MALHTYSHALIFLCCCCVILTYSGSDAQARGWYQSHPGIAFDEDYKMFIHGLTSDVLKDPKFSFRCYVEQFNVNCFIPSGGKDVIKVEIPKGQTDREVIL